jgi:hypothetical protein
MIGGDNRALMGKRIGNRAAADVVVGVFSRGILKSNMKLLRGADAIATADTAVRKKNTNNLVPAVNTRKRRITRRAVAVAVGPGVADLPRWIPNVSAK